MNMDLEDRLLMGKVLITVLDAQTATLDDPYDDEIPLFIKRALMAQLRMKRFYHKHDEPPEMLEQLEKMDIIIKRLFDLQNKKCY